ncbi:DNA primase [Faecalibacter rhinopitheci]|uniref:DNA primase n=1 Tax=Faecalibacter rhinopitheci TaxID=2779678 RepID=A0A8J7FQM1_9FLAO|nr:DNA primase [Faecalibacter rhinopitheci]MBF0597929.1 DNA primase [Faecalibacter rhinopitheci]
MISKSTIDTIFNTARVEEVVGDFVQLKRAGSNFKGLSPFTEERTPSFVVSPAKQIWKDFSTGKGGNVVSFIMELEQFTYPEALRWLAKRYNIEIDEEKEFSPEQMQAEKTKESLFILTEFAKKFYTNQLHDTEEGQMIGLSYFKERGFSNEIIKKFELGYSLNKWDAFAEFAEQKGYSKELLQTSGLVTYKEDGKRFDKFRERVIFPIYSFSGRAIGFGGRILRNDAKAAKYLNSSENEIYFKSKTLYGLFQSKQAILKQNECFLVEGYTDVLSMHQSGIENVVASSGTALTKDQIRIIKRLTSNITVMYDGDAAGIRASFRGIDLILEQELNVKVLLFPDGEDPDSFARKHSASEISDYIKENSTDFIKFKAKLLLDEAKNDPVKKTELIREIIQSIALIPSLIQRELYVMETATIMDIREEVLFKYLAQILNKGEKTFETTEGNKKERFTIVPSKSAKEVVNQIQVVEEEIIRLIMQFGNLEVSLLDDEKNPYKTTVIEEIINQLEHNELELSNPFYQKIIDDVKIGLQNEELRTGDFYARLMDSDISQTATSMMIDNYAISENWLNKQGISTKSIEDCIEKDLFDVMLRFKTIYIEDEIKKLMDISRSPDFFGDARNDIMKKVMDLTKMKIFLNSHLDRII